MCRFMIVKVGMVSNGQSFARMLLLSWSVYNWDTQKAIRLYFHPPVTWYPALGPQIVLGSV